jgi:hypothetical protein
MPIDIDGQPFFYKTIVVSISGNHTEVRDIFHSDNLSEAIDFLKACADRGDFHDEEG